MKPAKQRRHLIYIFIFSLLLWLVWSFGPITLWYAKGGLPAPTAKTVSAVEYQALLDIHKDTVFHGFLSASAGYFLIAMIVLDLIVKTKPKDEGGSDA
jgi:hypothetical protein